MGLDQCRSRLASNHKSCCAWCVQVKEAYRIYLSTERRLGTDLGISDNHLRLLRCRNKLLRSSFAAHSCLAFRLFAFGCRSFFHWQAFDLQCKRWLLVWGRVCGQSASCYGHRCYRGRAFLGGFLWDWWQSLLVFRAPQLASGWHWFWRSSWCGWLFALCIADWRGFLLDGLCW